MRILLTGAAGFIGHSVSLNLLAKGETVFRIDNLNKYDFSFGPNPTENLIYLSASKNIGKTPWVIYFCSVKF